MKLQILSIIVVAGLLSTCGNPTSKEGITTEESIVNPTNKVLLSSEIKFEKLNPARGDQSPQAGTIWGDRNGKEATGFLAKFVDGFSSPPHIHNITYRAVVIEGLIHNDDPDAAKMWMPTGSFWTQPAGESHITAAKGDVNIALVEIDNGPYLVQPMEQAIDNGERPINIDASNIVWLSGDELAYVDHTTNVEISNLWQDGSSRGLFVKLPSSYDGTIETDGTVLHTVIIQGTLKYTLPQNHQIKTLDPGSYFGSTSKALHKVNVTSQNETLLYVRTNGSIHVR